MSRAARFALYATPLGVAALAIFTFIDRTAESSGLDAESVQIVGSETMRPVVTACAEEFMTRHPQADIVVKGGGSGDGIAALLHGITDIGMTSRDLSLREREYAESKGIELTLFELALDGITIIVNPANPVGALDLAQLRDIFAGTVRNWREVGGAAEPIAVVARAPGSGTATLFGERVMNSAAYASSAQQLPTNEAIVAEVARRPGAVGYSGLGALKSAADRIKVVALRTDRQPTPVTPSADAVRSGAYPLTRTLYLGAVGKPTGTVRAFLDFCPGPGGQPLLQRSGYVGSSSNAP